MRRRISRELREYHESPPTLVRDMELWLDVGDRRAAAERVRRWVIESYELAPLAKTAPPPRTRARAAVTRRAAPRKKSRATKA